MPSLIDETPHYCGATCVQTKTRPCFNIVPASGVRCAAHADDPERVVRVPGRWLEDADRLAMRVAELLTHSTGRHPIRPDLVTFTPSEPLIRGGKHLDGAL